MIKKIRAEFENIDSAEWAARAIKSRIDGVAKIKITGKKEEDILAVSPPFNRLGIGGIGATGVFYPYNSGFVNTDDSQNSYNGYSNSTGQVEFGQEAILEVMCSEESISSLSKLLTSHGGLKIKKF